MPRSIWLRYGFDTLARSATCLSDSRASWRWERMKSPTPSSGVRRSLESDSIDCFGGFDCFGVPAMPPILARAWCPKRRLAGAEGLAARRLQDLDARDLPAVFMPP